jgi:hypothetical protein
MEIKTMKSHSIFRALIISAALISVPMTLMAQTVSKSGTTAAQFLKIPVGARSAALGGAVGASVNDASAMVWNPSAIANLDKNTIMVEHADWFLDLKHNYLGLVMPMKNRSAVGINLTALTMDEMTVTTFEDPEGSLGLKFRAYSYSLGLSYARYLIDQFAIGANVKIVNETIWNSSASAIAFDIGTTYETPFDGIILGVSITNFGQKMQINGKDLTTTVDIDPSNSGNNGQINTRLETDEFDLPLMLRVGLAWQPIKTEQMSATVMLDGTSPNDNNQSVSLGTELSFLNDKLALRAGLPYVSGRENDDRTLQFTAGAGLRHSLNSGLGFDFGYALNSYTNLGLVNRVSVSITF